MSEGVVGVARPIVIRLFLEGIEVPVLSANVSTQPNGPTSCVLQVPPSSLGGKLYERTLVHLFFLDSLETAGTSLTYNGAATRGRENRPTLYELSQQRNRERPLSKEEWEREERNSRYKLLFCGEVMALQEAKTATNRSLVLQCLDLTNYWDYAYQFNNSDLFGPGVKAIMGGGAGNLFTDFLSSPGEVVAGLLRLPSSNYPALKGVMGGMIRLIESIGGCYRQDNKFMGQNVFFSIAELRLRISQLLTAYPDDRSVNRLLGGGSPDGIFGRTLGNLGEQVSIRTVFNAIAGILFLETFNVPSPLFVPGSNNNVLGRNPRILINVPSMNYVSSIAGQGVLFCKEMVAVVESTDKGSDNKTTAKEKQLVSRRLSYMNQQVQKLLQRTRQDKKLDSAQNKRVRTLLQQIAQKLTVATSRLNQKWQPGMKSGPAVTAVQTPLKEAQTLFQQILDLELDLSDANTRSPQRLNMAIVRPNVWFSAPPRCNVLWPHHIFSQNYSINFMQQPTRLLLKVHDEFFGEDELFDNYFFAPRNRTLKGKRHKGTMAELFSREIMQHELFTGIVPLFTKMGEFNILAIRGLDEALKKPKDRPKISLAQRTANFLYFQKRFAARSMSIECTFNPYLAPGFPGLVFDRYVTPEDVEEYLASVAKDGKATPEKRHLLGSHYLGSFSRVSHTVSPFQAQTSIEVDYPREYGEPDNFTPDAKEDQTIVTRFGSDGVRNYVVAALEKPKLRGIGLHYGVIQEVAEVTEAVGRREGSESNTAGSTFPIYTGPRRQGETAEDGTAEIGVPVELGKVSPTLAARLGADKVVTFRAFRIREAIPRYRRDVIDLPAEEMIRPGWYDDVWKPSRIGLAYQHFLQTGAITDPMQIGDPGKPSSPAARKNVRDRLVEEQTGKTVGTPQDGVVDAVLSLDENSSVEQAVDFLLTVFAYIQQGNLSGQKFTDAYTWRPIASIPDVFGTSDLELDARGIDVIRGVEGIHSRAFGPYDDLFGLVTPEIEEIFGEKKTSRARSEGDVRGRRYNRVLAYRQAVQQRVQKGRVGG